MAKSVSALIFFFFLFYGASFGASVTYDIKNNGIDFILDFQNQPSNLTMLKGDKNIVFNFDTPETVNFKRQDFFDLPIKSAYISGENTYRKKFIVTFDKEIIDPKVAAVGKTITISFPVSPELLAVNTGDNLTTPPMKQPLAGSGTYFRMMFGLLVVLAVILIMYKLLKTYLNKQVFSDIPGSGRLLGKVDLDIRKSLYFYEIGDIIYIIGVTDSNMTLIDKIGDESDMTKIKAGLAKKREFAGYMSFFGKKNNASGLDADISASNILVEEKIKSLRKK